MDTSSDRPISCTSVRITPLANLIRQQLRDLDPISGAVCIYRVPPKFRQLNERAYTPQTVSIGPFHRGKPELQPWEEHKLRYLQAFLTRSGKSLEECIELVKGLEGRARACYRERIGMTSDAFVNMMLVDSSFIIEVIWRFKCTWRQTDDYLNTPELISLAVRDMILLENQIPFFVLHELFSLGFRNLGEDTFLKLTINYFSHLLNEVDQETIFTNVKRNLSQCLKIEHLTDLLRMCYLPSDLKKSTDSNCVLIPNATSLHEAGMKFKFGTSRCLLDIKYKNGLLEMPKFNAQDDSECLLKNIIALETCHYPFDSYIIDYIFFMDMLIDTATDVDLLIQKGIIVNDLSDSAAVASLFNNLGMETTLFGPYYFARRSNDMNKYCDVRWHKWKATFKRDYCSTPWMIASTVAAIILLLLTFIQAVCSVIST